MVENMYTSDKDFFIATILQLFNGIGLHYLACPSKYHHAVRGNRLRWDASYTLRAASY
jgi:hypothetical protein